MFKEFLAQVIAGEHLSRQGAQQSMDMIMSGQGSEAQIGAFITALRMKGETIEEITGFAETMRSHSLKIECGSKDMIDTCGTGGDKTGTFNVSTAVAFVLAGSGVVVAKHGNHGLSSSCGSADVLTALGVRVDLPTEGIIQSVAAIKLGFLYAPSFHKAMKYAAKPRKELGFRTVFNMLGPLTNPAGANYQLIGVYERSLTPKLAEALGMLGVKRAMVVHGLDGLDEISTTAPTQVTEVNGQTTRTYMIDPTEFGFSGGGLDAYRGGTPEDNANIISDIFRGNLSGPKRDIVLLNAGAAFVVAGKAENIKEGIAIAAKSIDSGAALAKMQELKNFSQGYKESKI
ncbi:anthranilate phosphoribosyltransferase [Pelosinus sp. UFO1]|uniref:anthranilate phosphoribosyltransferase n=1 Tax=Pelosinus sp. UFO1 TaxID=484770 RepID=UPI0004D10634|nr:anthranilate phosphoribosyltransferase [Pelosinus sp. UFO1]AIF52341.1 Anthranilate phosphoribosyltransferase [Pelosinus sp. UFO1]